jgi:hypothetical protein
MWKRCRGVFVDKNSTSRLAAAGAFKLIPSETMQSKVLATVGSAPPMQHSQPTTNASVIKWRQVWPTMKASEAKRRVHWAGAQLLVLAVGAVIGFGATRINDVMAYDAPLLDAVNSSRPLMLFIGDSLTELGESSEQSGWITRLRSEYSRSADIISRGYSGYNSR